MADSEKIASLKQQVAILKKMASDKLGKGYWGLDKESDDKFTHEEILFLFARIFLNIGFESIKEARTNYPDIIATVDGIEKGVELEPTASTFKHHLKDDLSLCNYVVCWKDDLDSTDDLRKTMKSNGIEVIELSKYYLMASIGKKLKSLVYSRKDIEHLQDGQLKLLRVFIKTNAELLTKEQLIRELGSLGKKFGGTIGGFVQKSKSKEWLVRKIPKGYQFNSKYRSLVKDVLKDYGYI